MPSEDDQEQQAPSAPEVTRAVPPLVDICRQLKAEYDIDGTVMSIVNEACSRLGVASEGLSLVEKSQRCFLELNNRHCSVTSDVKPAAEGIELTQPVAFDQQVASILRNQAMSKQQKIMALKGLPIPVPVKSRAMQAIFSGTSWVDAATPAAVSAEGQEESKEAPPDDVADEDSKEAPPNVGDDVAGADDNDTCPICFEVREGIEVLEHWEARGDVSGHKMCADCRKAYAKNSCPFCNEIVMKNELLTFISDMVTTTLQRLKTRDANQLAAVLERWQLFEMEHETQPNIVRRVAKLIIDDGQFYSCLAEGVQNKHDWLRDMAGILVRFHALAEDGELAISDQAKALLRDAMQTAIEPLERPRPPDLHGHYLGAFYMQILVPCLCAFRANTSHATLIAMAQRVGKAVVHCWRVKGSLAQKRREITERIHTEYLEMSHVNIWGSKEADVVWQAFFA